MLSEKKMIRNLLLALVIVALNGISYASTILIGSADYNGDLYNLIYEQTQGVIWLDYANSANNWFEQMTWAADFENSLTLNIDNEYNVIWNGDWQLAELDWMIGLNFDNNNPDLFENIAYGWHWSATDHPNYPPESRGWVFNFHTGNSAHSSRTNDYPALAGRYASVSAVPEPCTSALFVCGFLSLMGMRLKKKNL